MLEPAIHLQTLILLVLSSHCVSDSWKEYISWVQFTKFDFGFLNSILLKRWISWTSSSNKLANAQLYWEEAILNYFNLILILGFTVLLLKAIRCINWNNFLKYIQSAYDLPESQFWILWWLILPFFIINIYSDLITFRHHLRYSLFSSLILIISIWLWIYKKFDFLRHEFVQKIYPYNSLLYIYLSLFIKIPLILLFISSSQMVSNLLITSILMIKSTLLFLLIKHKVKLPLQENFNRSFEIFGNSVMLLVTMVISVNKVTSFSLIL